MWNEVSDISIKEVQKVLKKSINDLKGALVSLKEINAEIESFSSKGIKVDQGYLNKIKQGVSASFLIRAINDGLETAEPCIKMIKAKK